MDLQKRFYENLYLLFEQLSRDVYSTDFKKTLDIFLKNIDAYIRANPSDATLPRIVQLEQKINALKKTQKSSKNILDDISINILDIRKSGMPAGKGFFGGLFSGQHFRKAAVVTGIVAGSMLGGANAVQAQSHGGYQGLTLPVELKADSSKIMHEYTSYINAAAHNAISQSVTVSDMMDSGKVSTAKFKQGFYKDYFNYVVNGVEHTVKIPKGDMLLVIAPQDNNKHRISYTIFSQEKIYGNYIGVAAGYYFVGENDILRNNGGPRNIPLQSLGEL